MLLHEEVAGMPEGELLVVEAPPEVPENDTDIRPQSLDTIPEDVDVDGSAGDAEGEVNDDWEVAHREMDDQPTFTLKHLGETGQYSQEQVTALAQKGLDYDRIRRERDMLRSARSVEEGPLRTEMRNFVATFPQVKPEEIPKSVWQAVAQGEGLTSAYARVRSHQLEMELDARKQQEHNRTVAVGSLNAPAGEEENLIGRWWREG